jgi:hypothetical protein
MLLWWIPLVGLGGANAADVVINEVMPNPSGSDGEVLGEWLELLNTSDFAVDLSGCSIEVAKSGDYATEFSFPKSTVLEPGTYMVVGELGFKGADLVVDGALGMGQGTDGDGVRLVCGKDEQIDVVLYSNDTDEYVCGEDLGANLDMIAHGLEVPDCVVLGPGEGRSVARWPDGVDSDASRDDMIELDVPTPGLANDTEPPTCGAGLGLVLNEVFVDYQGEDSGADQGREWVELYHAGSEPIELTGWEVRANTSPPAKTLVVMDKIWMDPGDFLLVGGTLVEGVDVAWEDSKSLGNGSNSDGVELVDCAGYVADTVIYGSPNENEWLNDEGQIAESLAPAPGSSTSIARAEDGLDTNLCGDDFVLEENPSPGEPNPVREPVVCVPSVGGVVLNEVLPNPASSDDGLEWFELFNSTDTAVSLDGWGLTFALQVDDLEAVDVIFPANTTIPAGGFFVVGGELTEAPIDWVMVDMPTAGNGSGGDGIRLVDCEGWPVDTVVYGTDNEDFIPDDTGSIAEPVGSPGDGQSIARDVDGVDTDQALDWRLTGVPTPGATNAIAPSSGSSVEGPGGCGCGGSDLPSDEPTLSGREPGEGCSSVPGRFTLWAWLPLLVWVRRKR